jgi:hypothetical protein
MTTARTSYKPTGVKGLNPSPRDLVRLEHHIQVLRNRMERWIRIRYARMLRDLRDELGGAESEADILAIIQRFDHQQESVLRSFYMALFPRIEELVIPDDTIKAWNMGRETKARDEFQASMDEWIQTLMGINITYISSETLAVVRELFRASNNDPVVFMEKLKASGLFGSVRARRIAVTETTSGINSAMHEASRRVSFGRKMETVWKTTGRINVRGTHLQMEGKSVPFGTPFEVPRRDGGVDLMMYPGDSSLGASAANVVNCHCIAFQRYVS